MRIRIASRGDPLRQAVRGEDDLFAWLRPAAQQFLCERLNQQRVIVKRTHARELHAGREDGFGGVHVFLDAERRELGRQRNADDPPRAGARDVAHGVGDERPPVAHADNNRHIQAVGGQLCLQRVALLSVSR